jgi:glycerophosphoryl diester phosphodiesterase
VTGDRRQHGPTGVPSWVTDVPLAHRGLHDGPPALGGVGTVENTLAAFASAVDAAVGIELDVHLTRDGSVIVHHDYTLERICGVRARVAQVHADDLASLPGRIRPPTLDQALGLIAERVPVMVEIKPQPPARRRRLRAAVAEIVDSYAGPLVIASFDPQVVAWFARHRPGVLRAQAGGGSLPAWVRSAAEAATPDRWSQPDVVSHDVDRLPVPRVARARQVGIPVIVWTVGTATQLAIARRYADNVIFEVWDPSDPLTLDALRADDT